MGRKPSRPLAERVDPSRTYRIQIVPEGHEDVWRTVELRGDQSLALLDAVIHDVFQFEERHELIFLFGEDHSQDYGPGTGRSTEKRLRNLPLAEGARFLCDRDDGASYQLTVIGIGAAEEGAHYPNIIEVKGESPPSGHQCDLSPELHDLGEEAADVAEARVGDDEEPADLDSEVELARRLAGLGAETFGHVEGHFDEPIAAWMIGLPYDLHEAGRTDEAFALSAELEAVLPVDMPCARATLLHRAGRTEEAKALVDANLARFPDDVSVLERSAGTLREIDPPRAEALLRQAIDRYAAGDDDDQIWADDARFDLSLLLEELGRDDEAAAIRARLGIDDEDEEEDA